MANVTGGGALAVTNTSGPLTVNGGEFVRTDGGPITLSSGDDVVVNGFIGDSAATGAGLVTINANTDGTGTNGYTQGTRAGLSTSGDVTINVNTTSGGTGNATLAPSGIGGTLTVGADGGSIVWNSGLTIPADSATTNVAALSARNFAFSTTGETSGIGTLANPVQTNMIGTADNTAGNSNVSLQAGSGGIYMTAWGPLDPTVTSATAIEGGNIVLVAANAGGHELYVTGPITTESGNINLRSDDDLFLNAGTLIGGPGFVGTVTLQANQDGANEQRLHMDPAALIVTQNTTAGAVSLSVKATDTNVANATIGGIDLSNITVGDGGTITVDAAPGTGNQQGNITQAAGTVLNAGPDGKVVLDARSLLNAGAPAVGAGIGTPAAPVLTQAGTVTITATNSPTSVTEADGASFAADPDWSRRPEPRQHFRHPHRQRADQY